MYNDAQGLFVHSVCGVDRSVRLRSRRMRKYPDNRIRQIRNERGLTLEQLADRVVPSTSHDMVAKLERGERELTHTWMDRLAYALDCLPFDLIKESSNKIPVLGRVGAGGIIVPIDDLPLIDPLQLSEADYDTLNCEFVDAPPGVSPMNIACVVVRGDSMYPVYKDGEYLFYKRTPRPCSDSINLDCVVALEDGRVMVKTVRRGASYDTFSLDSYNQPPIMDVRIKWCAPVEWTHKKV
jgi:transcriptional regulator with XRE-family HTH domain